MEHTNGTDPRGREGLEEWQRIQTWLASEGYRNQVRCEYLRALNWLNLTFGTDYKPYWDDDPRALR